MISEQTKEYYQLGKKNDVRESAKRLLRQFLRYKDAEIVYSIQHTVNAWRILERYSPVPVEHIMTKRVKED